MAFLTLLERKILGLVGLRLGPSKVSFGGFLQPVADAVKLANKRSNVLLNYSFFFYYLRGRSLIWMSLSLWAIFFRTPSPFQVKLRVLFFTVILSLNTLILAFSGWSTLSKYTLIGRIRTICQLVSYEACLYLCIFFFLSFFRIYSFGEMTEVGIHYMIVGFPSLIYFWVPTVLAELNRSPFDFSEGERELVRGFNTDFSGFLFTLIFLREYSMILFFCFLRCFLFFWNNLFLLFLCFFFIIWIRSVLPRYRFDKLMSVCWKFFIPFLTLLFLLQYVRML